MNHLRSRRKSGIFKLSAHIEVLLGHTIAGNSCRKLACLVVLQFRDTEDLTKEVCKVSFISDLELFQSVLDLTPDLLEYLSKDHRIFNLLVFF